MLFNRSISFLTSPAARLLVFNILCASFFFFSVMIVRESSATDLAVTSGAMHLPASSYHYIGYGLRMRFGLGQTPGKIKFVTDLGSSHPFIKYGFSQFIFFGSGSLEWSSDQPSFFDPYVSAGFGFYLDRVSDQSGWVPSLVTQGGVRIGGSKMGVMLGLSNYVGIYSFSQLKDWIVWPLTNLMAGFYVRL